MQLYGCLFFLLDDEECLPYTCHLLYVVTTRRTVKAYRSNRLLSLYQHGLKTGQMIKPLYVLLQLYAQYDPSILLPKRPKMNLGYGQFQRIDEDWSARMQSIQRNRDQMSNNPSQLSDETTLLDFGMQRQVELETTNRVVEEERFRVAMNEDSEL